MPSCATNYLFSYFFSLQTVYASFSFNSYYCLLTLPIASPEYTYHVRVYTYVHVRSFVINNNTKQLFQKKKKHQTKIESQRRKLNAAL